MTSTSRQKRGLQVSGWQMRNGHSKELMTCLSCVPRPSLSFCRLTPPLSPPRGCFGAITSYMVAASQNHVHQGSVWVVVDFVRQDSWQE
ncbi:hypothetical protein BDR06DRAFT_956367 [Suillus hirtellus]|nr:hypothetical protein BDR06DRAFT_956367 [Suillus hirtellus]